MTDLRRTLEEEPVVTKRHGKAPATTYDYDDSDYDEDEGPSHVYENPSPHTLAAAERQWRPLQIREPDQTSRAEKKNQPMPKTQSAAQEASAVGKELPAPRASPGISRALPDPALDVRLGCTQSHRVWRHELSHVFQQLQR